MKRLIRGGLLGAALLVAAGTAVALNLPAAQALDNGTGRTPPMGWNSWNTFGCNINESLIRGMADSIVSSGMRDAGYQYVVVDDCWFNPNRDSAGNLQGDPSRFPSGMKALGDYLHSKGLKFGIYQVPVDKTCAQYFNSYPGATGSQGHEVQDARQFAAWGVDYLKYDWCSPSGTIDQQVATFARMRDALAATGRPIFFSINPNSIHAKTGPQRNWGDVSNMWRTTEDIQLEWDTGQTNGYPMGIQNILNVNIPLAGYAGPGHFNDPDMMEVGRGKLTDTEQRTHFALWAMMASPLIAGNDIRSQSSATSTILKNANLIAINQDTLALQATQISNDGTRRVLAKRLANGDVAVALFNQSSATTTISTTAAAAGKSGSSFTLRDVWSNATSTSSGAISASVPSHGTVVYRVSSAGTSVPPTSSISPTTAVPTTAVPTTVRPTTAGPTTPGSGCTATLTMNAWTGGFTADVQIAGSNTNGWTVKLILPAGVTVTGSWNANTTGNTGTVTFTNMSYNNRLPASFGFQATGNGTVAVASCTAA